MVSLFERARQRVALFFEPAVKTTREIVSQIPGVDVERPISPVPEVSEYKPSPRGGRGGGGAGITIIQTEPGISSAEQARRETQTRAAEEALIRAQERATAESKATEERRTEIQRRARGGRQEISPFIAEEQEPFLTRGEAKARRPFFKEVKLRAGGTFRKILGEERVGDITFLTGLKFKTKPEKVPIQFFPSGGTAFPEMEKTLKDIIEMKQIVSGAGKPIEFVAEDISKQLTSQAQTQLEQEAKDIQKSISSGTLDIGVAEQRLELRRKELQEQSQERFEEVIKPIVKRRAELRDIERGLETDVAPLIKTGGIVGGLIVAPVITGGIIATGGAKRFITSTERGILEEDITTKERLKKFGMAGIGLAEVGLGVGVSSRVLLKQIDIARLESLAESELRFAGEELIRTPKVSVFRIKGIKRVGTATAKVDELVPIMRVGERRFVIEGGLGKAETRFFSVAQERFVRKDIAFDIFAKGKITDLPPRLIKQITGKGFKGVSIKTLEAQAGLGKGRLAIRTSIKSFTRIKGIKFPSAKPKFKTEIITDIPKESIVRFRFGGVSKLEKDVFRVVGGDVKKLRFDIVTGKRTALFEPKTFGLIKAFKEPTEAIRFIRPRDIVKTPLSKTFQAQLPKQVQRKIFAPPMGFVGKGLQVSIQGLTPTITKISPAPVTQLIKSQQRFLDQTGTSRFLSQVSQRVSQLGILEGRIRLREKPTTRVTTIQKDLQKERQKILSKSELRGLQRPETRLKGVQVSGLRGGLKMAQVQRQQLKQLQKFQLKLMAPSIPTITFGLDFPLPPPPIILFPRLKGKKFKKKREKLWGKEDIALAESFTARQLGLEPIKLTEKQVRRMAKLPSAGLGLQRAPIIIR